MGRSVGTAERIEQQYDWAETSPSVAVIDAIANIEGLPTSRMAEQLDPPLEQTLPTDAFNALLEANHAISVAFTFAAYHVRITGDIVSVTREKHPSET